MSRKPIIAANWKMNIGPAEGAQFIESFKNLINGKDVSCDVVIIPPFTTIPSVQNALAVAPASPPEPRTSPSTTTEPTLGKSPPAC